MNSSLVGNVAGYDQRLSLNYFLFYRTPDGKLYASRILRIENINEKNLEFSYNCAVASEGGIDTINFVLLKKGMRKFYRGSLWKLRTLLLRHPSEITTPSFYSPGSKFPKVEIVNLVSQAFRLNWGSVPSWSPLCIDFVQRMKAQTLFFCSQSYCRPR